MKSFRLMICAAFTVGVFLVGFSLPTVSESKDLQPLSIPVDANIFVKLAERMIPAVVNISTLARPKGLALGDGSQEELFRRFFEDFFQGGPGFNGPGSPRSPRGGRPKKPKDDPSVQPRPLALGTGFIIDASGLILTNNHVVAGAEKIQIRFSEEDEEEASEGTVVGRDADLDLALIRVKTKKELTAVLLGDSDQLKIGEYVAAVGNPFGHGHSVTHGIISQKGRNAPEFQFGKYLQTDAPINPGNSGGPLVNLRGEVIGINNAIDARGPGIGFAIPINLVKSVLPQLKSSGSVSRGFIGVQIGELTAEIAQKIGVKDSQKGAFVAGISRGSPAEKAGLRPYDVILTVGNKAVRKSGDVVEAVTSSPVGSDVKVKILRDGKEMEKSLKIAKRPTDSNSEESKKLEEPGNDDEESFENSTGMEVKTLTPALAKEFGHPADSKGVVITDLSYEGKAARQGLGRGDLIIDVDKNPIRSKEQLIKALKDKKTYLVRVRKPDSVGVDAFQIILLNLK